jgi:hypothetical protein
MIVLVGGMSGVGHVQFNDEQNSLTLTITSSLAHFQVGIQFKPASTTIQQIEVNETRQSDAGLKGCVQISPYDVIPFSDIVDSSVDETDIQSLVNAILDRINTFQRRQQEIDGLAER